MVQACKAMFLDLGGVLYDGSRPIAGAVEFIARARAAGLTLRFVTNTATKSAAGIVADLARMGIAIEARELLTAPLAARAHILAHRLRPMCIIHEAIRPDFADIEQHDPNCVLLGDAREGLGYAALNAAFRLCKAGAPLIGIGLNKYFMDDQGLMLDAGAFIRGLEWAADTKALIMGKPGRAFFEEVVATTPYAPGDCLMVGDDVLADVAGAMHAGLQACLVRTGKYHAGDDQHLPRGAQVVDRLSQLLQG